MKNRMIPIFVLIICSAMVIASPPSLTDFQQFYGQIQDLPEGSYTLKAVVGEAEYTADIMEESKFGYTSAFNVYGPGDVIQFFVIDGVDLETPVGTIGYDSGAVTQYDDLKFPLPITPEEEEQAEEEAPAEDALPEGAEEGEEIPEVEEVEAAAEEAAVEEAEATPEPVAEEKVPEEKADVSEEKAAVKKEPQKCQEKWECDEWSPCLASRQLRACYRADKCTFLIASGEDVEIISAKRPAEKQACQSVQVGRAATPTPSYQTAPAKVCQPYKKQCKGKELQECSSNGQSWETIDYCDDGCDFVRSRCKESAGEETKQDVEKSSNMMMFAIGGGILFIAIIALVFFLLKKKPQAPSY